MAETDEQGLRTGRRQRRITRRRRQIAEAAAAVFATEGYANTTTRSIAEAADMAEGTLYNYFDSKRDILLAIFEQFQVEADVLLDSVTAQSRDDIVAIVERGFELVLSRLPFARILWMEAWADDDILREFGMQRVMTLFSKIKAYIVRGMDTGRFRRIDPDLATKMALGLFFMPLLPVMRGATQVPSIAERREMAEAAVDLMMHGLEV